MKRPNDRKRPNPVSLPLGRFLGLRERYRHISARILKVKDKNGVIHNVVARGTTKVGAWEK